MLNVSGILPNQPALEVVDYGNRAFVGTTRVGFTDSVDTLVSVYLNKDQIPVCDADEVCLDIGDFYGWSCSDSLW
jgi:hypothetical protein